MAGMVSRADRRMSISCNRSELVVSPRSSPIINEWDSFARNSDDSFETVDWTDEVEDDWRDRRDVEVGLEAAAPSDDADVTIC